MRAHSGFSLIEVLVGLLLTIVTFGVLWSLYYFDNKRVTSSMGRLSALRGAESIVEHLKADLDSLALPSENEYRKWGGQPLLLETAGGVAGDPGSLDRLTFYRRTTGKAAGEATEKVVYRLDPKSRLVLREAGGRASPIGASPVARFDLTFRGGLGGDFVLYELALPYGSMDSSAAHAASQRLLAFRGQIDLVDSVSQSRRTRWVSGQ